MNPEVARTTLTPYPFSSFELARLAVYHAAVRAGRFSDLGSDSLGVCAAFAFTPAELDRLATYRAAIKAGFYSDYPGK
jgi:hypothetical protein